MVKKLQIIVVVLSLIVLVGCSSKINENMEIDDQISQSEDKLTCNIQGESIGTMQNEEAYKALYEKLHDTVPFGTYILQGKSQEGKELDIYIGCTGMYIQDQEFIMSFDIYNLSNKDIEVAFRDIKIDGINLYISEKDLILDSDTIDSKTYKNVTLSAPIQSSLKSDAIFQEFKSGYVLRDKETDEIILENFIYMSPGISSGSLDKLINDNIK